MGQTRRLNLITKQEKIEQLRLAAEILEKDLEWQHEDHGNWSSWRGICPVQDMIAGYKIRIKPKDE